MASSLICRKLNISLQRTLLLLNSTGMKTLLMLNCIDVKGITADLKRKYALGESYDALKLGSIFFIRNEPQLFYSA